jgi:hypothetical protein
VESRRCFLWRTTGRIKYICKIQLPHRISNPLPLGLSVAPKPLLCRYRMVSRKVKKVRHYPVIGLNWLRKIASSPPPSPIVHQFARREASECKVDSSGEHCDDFAYVTMHMKNVQLCPTCEDWVKFTHNKNSVALSPQANYTDWATTTFRRNLVSTVADRGVSRGQRGWSLTAVNLSFLNRSRFFSFK